MAFKLHLVPPNPYITLVGGIKMAATIPRDNLSSSPLLDDVITIIVLENEPVHKEAIQDLIKESNLGWPVFFAKDKEEVEKLAEEHNAAYYILDINLGPEKNQEGITTAEFIKNGEQNTFVAMFSGVPNLAEFKRMASRIGVDYFEEKSGNIQWNVCRIALEILRYQKHLITEILERDRTSICKLEPLKVKSLTNQLKRINDKLAKIEELERSYRSDNRVISPPDSSTPSEIKEDNNIHAYEKLMEDEAWVTEFNGKYVAFADGKQLDIVADNLTQLLDKLRNSIYKSESIVYMQISKEEKQEELEEPMSCYDIEPYIEPYIGAKT
jgi:DNA-binding NarL/FixJ family response regulator